MAAQPAPELQLERRLTAWDAMSLVVGSVIGAGIFLMPHRVATLVPSPPIIMGLWVAAGIISLFGALAIAELGARYPHAGGLYVYLRRAWGPGTAFLYGWSLLVAIQTGNIASLGAAIPIYLGYLVPLSPVAAKATGVGAIVALTAVNCLGVKRGAKVQNVLTAGKIATLVGMTVLLLLARREAVPPAPVTADWNWSSLGLAAIAVLWAYECWHLVTFAAGEVRQPERNIPRGLLAGMAIVVGLYLAANAGYLNVLSVGTMQARPDVAAVAMERVVGTVAGAVVSAMILCSLLGAMNGLILSGPRVYYAMARDRVFIPQLAAVSPRFHVPVKAILFQGVLAAALTLVGTFAQLVGFVISSAWVFYALTVAAVWRIRRREGPPSGFRCPAYRVLGTLFIAFAVFIVLSQVVRQPREAAMAAGIIFAGLPAYWFWRRAARVEGAAERQAG